MNIIALDFETGGLSPDRHAITQLALVACRVSGGKATIPTLDRSEVGRFVRVWSVRPAPSLMIEEEALRIQGHNRGTLLARPNQVPEAVLITQVQEFLAGLGEGWECAPFIAHNAKFDHSFLEALCRRTRKPLPPRSALCTVDRQRELVRRKAVAKAENNKLGTLAKLLGLKQDEAHDACQDAKLCASLFAWQEHLLAGSGNLLGETEGKLVGLVYEHEPAAADGWWTRHGEEFPIKAPEASHPQGKVCGGCGSSAQWRRPYRLGARRGAGSPPMHQFFACDKCKANDIAIANAIGLSGDERVTWEGEWFKLILSPSAVATIAPAKPAATEAPKPFFSCSKDLCELHRKAKSGELVAVPGFSTRTGPVEDPNRFVIGAFRSIQMHLEDLDKLAKIQQKAGS